MGEVKGFLAAKRKPLKYRKAAERIKDYREVCVLANAKHFKEQASRCMDCGTPFCHWGCPLGNYIAEWNDLVFRGLWEKAFQLLSATNNLPEITGRVCPALCEYACVLGINDEAVTIRENELAIAEYAFNRGLIKAHPPKKRTGKKIAVIGSGPAGLACADQLNKAGHSVVIFEKDDKVGGILRYGIPDFKLEKSILERRIKILKEEGIKFQTSIEAGIDYETNKLKKEFDVVCLACGCRQPRDLKIPGRGLKGIHFAMDCLIQSNRRVAGEEILEKELIDAKGKKVVVIGGGDTGADCVGIAHRQKARSIMQIEILPKPPECRSCDEPWPQYPLLLKSSSSHEEGGIRDWGVCTKRFVGRDGRVKKLSCVKVSFKKDEKGCLVMKENSGSEFKIQADLVILALGFLHPEKDGLLEKLNLELDMRGNIKTNSNFMTSQTGIFACGDVRREQSLVIWAISEGRKAAHFIDEYLMGESRLSLI